MITIRDMLYVNGLERRLGRKLTDEELDDTGELELRFPSGRVEFHTIPRVLFPDDLLPNYALFSIEHRADDDLTEDHEGYGNEYSEAYV